MSSSSSLIAPTPPRSIVNRATSLPQPSTNSPAPKDATTSQRNADISETQSPSRLPVTRNSSSSFSSSSLVRMADKTSKEGSMLPPTSRISSKQTGRAEQSRPSVTRSAALDAAKRFLQRQSATSRSKQTTTASPTTNSFPSRHRAVPTSKHSRSGSTAASSSIPAAPGHLRTASSISSQNTGNAPPPAPLPRTLKPTRPMSMYDGSASHVPPQSRTLKPTRPLSLLLAPHPSNDPATQVQQQAGTRQARSSTSSAAAPPKLNGVTRSGTGLLNEATILKPPLSPALADPKRPAFSTLQQHFSPNRNLGPKPATASFLAAPTPSKLPENKLITAETAKFQSELLQLHLLHRDSASVRKQWEDSARRKLCKKFEGVAERHKELVALENQAQIQINISTLKKWADLSTLPLEELSMVLGEVITGVWSLSEPGGKYAKVVRRFEKWVSDVQSIMTSRDEKSGGASMQFIEGLDEKWVHDCDTLVRKLEGFKEQLDGLGVVPKEDGSSLEKALSGCTELTHGMISELGVMKSIEQEALLREEEWIRQSIADISDGDEDVGGGVWRR